MGQGSDTSEHVLWNGATSELRQNFRRQSTCETVGGRVFLLPCSQPRNRNRSARTPALQLPLSRPSPDSKIKIPNFEDGNVEVLCGNMLFHTHTSVLSLHSPVLSWMLAKANLAAAESPNGCPRIPSSDTATDFATLLGVIYLPGYVVLPLR